VTFRLFLATALALALAGTASAADRLAVNASGIRLAVSKDGKTALVTFSSGGAVRHVLVWGAVNALPPSETTPQVQFKLDFSGGWKTKRKLVWKTFGNACKP
jgi:hypothetical protein